MNPIASTSARTGAIFLVVMASLRCGSLDSVDHVQDLRVLGVQAEPPEQLFPIEALDGGLTSSISTQPVTVKALLADPNGQGRPIQYTFALCAHLDHDSQRCLSTSPGYQVFATGETAGDGGWTEISATFTADDQLLAEALALDAYHGVDGLPLPIQLTVSADNQHLVGNKLVVYTVPTPGIPFVPEHNPIIQGIAINGHIWEQTAVYPFNRAQQPDGGWTVEPLFDPSLEVAFEIPSFSGEPLQFKESWQFDYFSTYGGFSPSTAGGTSVVSTTAAPVTSRWEPPNDTPSSDGIFWFVVRNGRGGENWLVRRGHFTR